MKLVFQIKEYLLPEAVQLKSFNLMIQTVLFHQQSIWYLLILELSRYLYAVNYDIITL